MKMSYSCNFVEREAESSYVGSDELTIVSQQDGDETSDAVCDQVVKMG